MTITIDSDSPIASLEEQGITCKITHGSSSGSFSVGMVRVPVSNSSSTRYRFTLTEAPSVQVSFSPEKFRHKIIKVFKKELQLNEAEFDAAVYIDTDEQDRVTAFLALESTRNLVLDIVGAGGQITAADKELNVILSESVRSEAEDQLLAAMVLAAVVNFQFHAGQESA